MARVRGLSRAELRLWAAFTETVEVLPGRGRVVVEAEPPVVDVVSAPAVAGGTAVAAGAGRSAGGLGEIGVGLVPAGLDRASWKSFVAGKVKAARRLDLHGLTATRAHVAVTNFIERAYGEQVRCVEIITGKGEVLARELPFWLNAPGVRARILAVAHPHAANTGSVRVLLRRDRKGVAA